MLYYIAGHCLFTDLHESDSGNYTCKASSETGETSQSATLLVFISKTKQRNLPVICHFFLNQSIKDEVTISKIKIFRVQQKCDISPDTGCKDISWSSF